MGDLNVIQPGTEIQLLSGSNDGRSRWMNVRDARVGSRVIFPRTSERRAIRRMKIVWFGVVLPSLFAIKIKKKLERLNEKELMATLTHIRTTAGNGNTLGPVSPYLGLGRRGDGEGYILNSLSFWSDCNRPIVCFHSTNYKDELLQSKKVPKNKIKIKRMRLKKVRTFCQILFRSIDGIRSCTPLAPQVLQDIL